MKPAIEVRGVWKQYNKGIDRRYKSLRDTLVSLPSLLRGEDTEKFWALEDINFDVMPGESVGIIGRNGAGKSTLLKILSRITPPTKGEIILRGRVASLLEVGTGFHPELTGRENIFFNGSILGMKYAEIRNKLDEIIDFSGVESFIDTPLKHYSSGMQMRLAFSVAAHLDSEILLIDEVLAVGDAEFQKKCIGKMDEVSKGEGKTILIVSHNLETIIQLCKTSLLLTNSKVHTKGVSATVIQTYLNFVQNLTFYRPNTFNQDKSVAIESVELRNSKLSNAEDLEIKLIIQSKISIKIGIETIIRDDNYSPISYSSTQPMQNIVLQLEKGTNIINFIIADLRLAVGTYVFEIRLIDPWKEEFDYVTNISFEVVISDPFNTGFSFLKSYNRGHTFNKLILSDRND